MRWRRVTQPTPPDLDDGLSSRSDRKMSLLYRHPFQIGFFLAIGAITAYGMLTVVTRLQNIVVLLLLALCIALGLNPAVEWFHRRGLRRGLCVILVVLLALIIVGLALTAVVPVAITQINQLISTNFLDVLLKNPQINEWDKQFHFIDQLNTFITDNWQDLAGGLAGGVVGATTAVATGVFSVIFTTVMTLYFLASLPTLKEVIYRLAPSSRRPRVRYLANEMLNRIGGYVSGLFIVALLDSTFTLIYLNIAGLAGFPGLAGVSLALAAMVAMLAFVPLVGSTIYIIVIVIVAFSYSPTLGVVTLIVYLVYSQMDAYLIQPRIFSRSVKVPGVMIVVAAVSGGFLFGMIGAILAVPTMAALLLLYREVLIPHLDRS